VLALPIPQLKGCLAGHTAGGAQTSS